MLQLKSDFAVVPASVELLPQRAGVLGLDASAASLLGAILSGAILLQQAGSEADPAAAAAGPVPSTFTRWQRWLSGLRWGLTPSPRG